MIGMKPRLVPFAAVERGVLVGVARDFLQAFENRLLTVGRMHGFALGKPVARRRLRQVVVVVTGWERPIFHGSGSCGMRWGKVCAALISAGRARPPVAARC